MIERLRAAEAQTPLARFRVALVERRIIEPPPYMRQPYASPPPSPGA